MIFRITHRDNLPWLLQNGLYAPSGGLFDQHHRNIGNIELIDKRTEHPVPVSPGGTLSDYIPFYFTPFSIMMYNIHTGRNVPRVPNEEIVILVSSLPNVSQLGASFVFTDQHAFRKTASFFTDVRDLSKIDWALLNRRDFKYDPDDPGKTDRYQAEALLWRHLPITALLRVCCYSIEVEKSIQDDIRQVHRNLQTSVQRNWYFQ